MDRLSFDQLHANMQEESRAESPTKVSTGKSYLALTDVFNVISPPPQISMDIVR